MVTPVLAGSGIKDGQLQLQQMSKDDPHLVMTSSSSPDHHLILQVDNNKAPKGLGVYTMNFKGTFGIQAKKMRLKFDTMGQQLRQITMSPLLASLQVLLHYHLTRLVAARASGRGTGQQMLSTYYSYTPASHQARTTSPPTLATPIYLPTTTITIVLSTQTSSNDP